MISYLPELYPDELAYSWFCRYYVHSGALTHQMALSDILCKRSCNPSKEFLGNLTPEMQSKIRDVLPIKALILEHTMFPQYARFIPLSLKMRALNHLEHEYCDAHHLFPISPRSENDSFLKYCSLCASEDRQLYGETYWHRVHQIRGIQTCCKHACYLEFSEVTAKSEQTYTLCPAEDYTTITAPRMAVPSPLLEYTRYLTEVFTSPLLLDSDTPIHAILYYAMKGRQYIASTGRMRYTRQLHNDMKAYYEDIGITEIASFDQVQRHLLGNRYDFSVVCQIAYFLGIPVTDLTESQLTEEQMSAVINTSTTPQNPPRDWEEYDHQLYPILHQRAKEIYYGSAHERPERVSERLVYRELKLPAHSLEKLPKCRAVLGQYSESYEECWARRIIWAYRKLEKERVNSPFYWSDIRKLSGVKKEQIEIVIPFVLKHTDEETTQKILCLL